MTEVGRNRPLIAEFFQNYTKIIDKTITDVDIKNLARNVLVYKKQYPSYANDCKRSKQKKENMEVTISSALSTAFTIFYKAAKLYKEHRSHLTPNDITEIYIKSNISYQRSYFRHEFADFETYIRERSKISEPRTISILKQSLMEFNNAISHINSAFWNRYPNDNIKRSLPHLERGALDFYKAIIRDRMTLRKFSDEAKDEIKKIRCLEYSKIGKVKRVKLFDQYHDTLYKHIS